MRLVEWVLIGFFAIGGALLLTVFIRLLKKLCSFKAPSTVIVSDPEIIREFQKRRTRFMRTGGIGFVVAGMSPTAILVSQWLGNAHWLLVTRVVLVIAFFVGLICFVGWAFYLYRCPHCGRMVAERGWLLMDPLVCPSCQIALK